MPTIALFQIAFLPDPGAGQPHYYDHVGGLDHTVQVLRQGHMDSWFTDNSHVGYAGVIATNDQAIQAFATGSAPSALIVVPFGQLFAFNCGSGSA